MAIQPEFDSVLRSWSQHRLMLNRTEDTAEVILRSLIGVYSSNPSAPLTLAVRAKQRASDPTRELEEQKLAIRIPGMRMSIFMTPTEFAPDVFAATKQLHLKSIPARLKWAGLDQAGFESVRLQILELTRDPISTTELQRAIPINERLMTAVRLMAHSGEILRLSASSRTDNLRYVATDAWLGAPIEPRDPEAAMRWLAISYLTRFGPARLKDVAWWIGTPQSPVKAALTEAALVDVGGGHLLPESLVEEFASSSAIDPEAITLLPKWDVYTMGYEGSGRRRFLSDEHRGFAYSQMGDGLPLVLQGGLAVGSWNHRFSGDRMAVTVSPFPGTTFARELADHDFAAVGAALGAKEISVVTLPVGG